MDKSKVRKCRCQVAGAQLVGICDFLESSLSTKSGGLFTGNDDLQTQKGHSSKSGQYLPKIEKKCLMRWFT